MKRIRKLVYALLAILLLGAAYMLTMLYPQPFFKYRIQDGNTYLYSDRPFSGNAELILKTVNNRLSKSDIFNKNLINRVFISNDILRFKYFVFPNFNVAGINYGYLNRNVFLRPANISQNRLIAWTGKEVQGDRTLVYYITHEITHGQVFAYLGIINHWYLPRWVREGYADYIGKGKINFEEAVLKFQEGDPTMDVEKSGLYLRYHLLVSYLLDVKGVSTDDLLHNKYDEKEVEKEIKNIRLPQDK
jgi:hypothetical protein